MLAIFVISGCGDFVTVDTFEPITDPAQLFMKLTLNHKAINLALADPYDTLQLVAVPRNALGEPIDGLPKPVFRSSDTTRVWVTSDGLIQARRAGTGVRVIAELVADGNIRHVDTALVNVVASTSPPKLTVFSITPETPEEAVWGVWPLEAVVGGVFLTMAGMNVRPGLVLRALNENGSPVSGLQVQYESLDPDIILVDGRGNVRNVDAPGTARLVARTYAYGAAYADTAVITVTPPQVHGIQLSARSDGTLVLEPTEVVIRPNGYVFWSNLTEKELDIVFDDPTNVADIPEVCATSGEAMCGGGNIAPFDGSGGLLNSARGRRFPVPGVYPFHSKLTGFTGKVIVTDGPIQ